MPRTVTLFAKAEPSITGTSRYTETLARELATLGWQVDVSVSSPPWSGAIARLARRLGADISAFWHSYPLTKPAGTGEVLHITSQTLATALLRRGTSRPTVVTVHDILPYQLRREPRMSALRHPLDLAFYTLALRLLRRADLILADSEYTARSLVVHGAVNGAAIRVVPLGVDITRFATARPSPDVRARLGLPEGLRYVVYVGSEHPRKNLDVLIEMMAAVAGRFPDLRLVKVGRPHHLSERVRLRALATRLGIDDRVIFLDDVPEGDLPAVYALATVSLVPSLYEGFGLPVLEAMASGVPVICSNRTSLPEVAGDAAVQVEPTAANFASALTALLEDPPRLALLRESGLRRAREFTWHRTAELTAQAYEAVLSRTQ